MKYLLLLYRNDDVMPDPGTPAGAAMASEYGAVMGELAKAGVLVDTSPLHASSAASTVRVRDGQILITDVPTAEIKEFLGGFTVIQADDLDEAIAWAAKIPAAAAARIDIYPAVAVPGR